MKKKTKTVKIKNCQECPYCIRESGGQGTWNFWCNATATTIVYHAENKSEEPQDGKFPEFCPL